MRKIILILLYIPFFAQSQSYGAEGSYVVEQAVRFIREQWGEKVRVKNKPLYKFGENQDVDQALETVWYTGGELGIVNENYQPANTNGIDSVVAEGSDTQEIVIEGHTAADDNLTFVTQTLTLTGNTPVALTTPLHRATRLFNNSGTNFTDNIYVYAGGGGVTGGVPNDADSVYITVPPENNQTLKASTSLSQYDYWIIIEGDFGVDRNGSARVQFLIEIREYGKVFRVQREVFTGVEAPYVHVQFTPAIVVPANADVRVRAISSADGADCYAGLGGYLATTQ